MVGEEALPGSHDQVHSHCIPALCRSIASTNRRNRAGGTRDRHRRRHPFRFCPWCLTECHDAQTLAWRAALVGPFRRARELGLSGGRDVDVLLLVLLEIQ